MFMGSEPISRHFIVIFAFQGLASRANGGCWRVGQLPYRSTLFCRVILGRLLEASRGFWRLLEAAGEASGGFWRLLEVPGPSIGIPL